MEAPLLRAHSGRRCMNGTDGMHRPLHTSRLYIDATPRSAVVVLRERIWVVLGCYVSTRRVGCTNVGLPRAVFPWLINLAGK